MIHWAESISIETLQANSTSSDATAPSMPDALLSEQSPGLAWQPFPTQQLQLCNSSEHTVLLPTKDRHANLIKTPPLLEEGNYESTPHLQLVRTVDWKESCFCVLRGKVSNSNFLV